MPSRSSIEKRQLRAAFNRNAVADLYCEVRDFEELSALSVTNRD